MIIEDDGITHINIYSKSKVEIGRMLSNFYESIFIYEGEEFRSIEGLWFYLSTSKATPERDKLKSLVGFEAKKFGSMLQENYPEESAFNNINVPSSSDEHYSEDFKNKIGKALRIKINSNLNIKEQLFESSLPFKHYYVYKGNFKYAGYDWLTELWEKIRRELWLT